MGTALRRVISASLTGLLAVAQLTALLPALAPQYAAAAHGADLVVTAFTAPATIRPGDTASYTWTIANRGDVRADAITTGTSPWGDQVWLSTSPTSIAGARGAGGRVAVRSLDPGTSYDSTFSATIPALTPPGSYYFILQTDSNGQIAEGDETNNLSVAVPVTVVALPRIAYVYASDAVARDAFVSFLTGQGFAVDALTITAAETANFSGYRAIVISDDSGSLSAWGTPAAVSNIAGSGKRTLGVGQGGYAYFGRKSNGSAGTIGWGNGAHGTGSSVKVVDATDPAWTTPNAIGAANGATVSLYTGSVTEVSIFDETASKGHRYIGQHATDARYQTVIGQSLASCDVLWGFSGSPATMTATGKALFENLLAPCALVSISAEVREDLDGDGVFDANEPLLTAPRLEVFRVNADGTRTAVGAAVNSPNITVSGIEGGTFDVVETDPAGYGSTSPNTVRVKVPAGATSASRFLDARNTVSGVARHRETPDGTTIVDVVLAGATVTLIKPDGTKQRFTAGAGGAFSLGQLAPSTQYTVGYDGSAAGRHYVTGVRFTTNAVGGGDVPAPQAVYNRKNHTWLSAFPLTNNTPVPDQVWRRGQATWYRFAIAPQQTVTIELKNCAFNCDLVVYKDLRQVQARLLADAQTQAGVRTTLQGDIMADDLDADDLDADDLDADDLDADDLDADDLDADDLDADDLDADDLDADDLDADDLDADDLDADDLDADDLDADDLDADDLDADDLDADDLDADDLDAGDSETYVAVQRKGLRAASLTPGLANETIVINTRDLTGALYIRVAGGASLTGVFNVTARKTTDAACVTAPLIARAPSTVFGASVLGKRSLILTDTAAYGLTVAARGEFLAKLGTFAAHGTVGGHVVDLADDANVQQLRAEWSLSRTCVAQANLVTDAIREVVRRFRTASGSFEYLINVGGDSVIPFRRVADWAEISRESRYNPPLAGASASEASLIADTFLSDDFYVSTAVDGPNRTLYLPDAAVGRLVESVTDVGAYIDMYLDAGGVASPTTALSSGYDFNIDLANYVTLRLTLQGLNVDAGLVSNTWSSADWRAKVLERAVADAFGILSLQGHFSANRLVPADNGQRVLSSELAAITDDRFKKALVYTLGCHSGYSIVDADGTILTQKDAFPEVFVRKGATVVAGTGYQYGETILMKNTEALIALLTEEIGYSTGPSGESYAAGVPIGKALMHAKRAYMGGLKTVRGIDLKVVGVSTVYGSPTMAFKLPAQQARPTAGTLAPAQVTGFAGLDALDVTASQTLKLETTPTGSYYTANGATTVAPYRPIAPLVTIDANVARSVLQGAVFLGGAYTEGAFTPRLSIPATELGGDAPRYANDVFMPVLPVTTNLFDGDALQIVPFQYLSNALGTSGTARVFGSGVQVRAFWSSATGLTAAADAPAIRDVSLKLDATGKLVVIATVRGLASPGVAEVWLTHTDVSAASRSFSSVAMAPLGAAVPDPFGSGFTRLYGATLPGTATNYRFLVQAVSGNGRVVAATNNGELYRYVTPQPAPTQSRAATTLAVSAPSSASYRSTITATATLDPSLDGKTITFGFGGTTRSALTANGSATATFDVKVTPRAEPYALTASFAGDTTATGSTASTPVVVTKAPTTLAALTASPQYSDGAAVARLTAHGLTLNEQPIVITRGSVSLATFTDFAGDVRFDTIDFAAGAGTSDLTITFPGNDRYAGASLSVSVQVRTENATVTVTQLGPQPTGSVTFDATVAQAADGSLGDLTRGRVEFTYTPEGGIPTTATAPVSASGAASLTVTLPPGLYQVTAKAGRDFASDVVAMSLPVYDASAFVSGGGWLTTGTDSLGVPLGARANVGFLTKYGVDGSTATGNLTVHVKSATGKDNDTDAQAQANGSVKLKATSFEWLVIAGNGAAFAGSTTVNGAGSYRFRADVVKDAADLVVIHVWDPATGGSYASPKYIVRGNLGGGSIRIHR